MSFVTKLNKFIVGHHHYLYRYISMNVGYFSILILLMVVNVAVVSSQNAINLNGLICIKYDINDLEPVILCQPNEKLVNKLTSCNFTQFKLNQSIQTLKHIIQLQEAPIKE